MKILYFIFPLIIAVSLSSCAKIPTDNEMINNFNQHKAIFQELVNMICHDTKVSAIYGNKNHWDKYRNISNTKLLKYRTLLKKANLRNVWVSKNRQDIVLGYYYRDIFKEYVYTKIPPRNLSNNLDNEPKTTGTNVYRHIEGYWYLHYLK